MSMFPPPSSGIDKGVKETFAWRLPSAVESLGPVELVRYVGSQPKGFRENLGELGSPCGDSPAPVVVFGYSFAVDARSGDLPVGMGPSRKKPGG
jgi:hypothetical protein